MNDTEDLLKASVEDFIAANRIAFSPGVTLPSILLNCFRDEYRKDKNQFWRYTSLLHHSISSEVESFAISNHVTYDVIHVRIFNGIWAGKPTKIDVIGHNPLAVQLTRTICENYLLDKQGLN